MSINKIEWIKRYLIIIDRYANIIKGQLHGHTHQDAFEIIHSFAHNNSISGIAFEDPCLTSNGFLYPSYRVYYMNPDTFDIVDYTQYRFDLNYANANDKPKWRIAYNFKEYYGVNQFTDKSFEWIAKKIKTDNIYYKKFAKMIFAEGPRSTSMANNLSLKNRTYCRVSTAYQEELEKCNGGPGNVQIFSVDYLKDKFLIPEWEYLIKSE